MRVGRCASDLLLWAPWALRVVQLSVLALHVASWSVVALRDGLLVFMQLDVQDVIFQSCRLRDAMVVQKWCFSGVAQPLRDARCPVVSDHSRFVAAPLVEDDFPDHP